MSAALKQRWGRPLGLGLLLFVPLFALRIALQPLIGSQFGFMFFFPAIGAAAWWGGRRAGLFVTALTLLSVWYLWMPPAYSFAVDGQGAFHLAAFAVTATLIVYYVGNQARAVAENLRLREDLQHELAAHRATAEDLRVANERFKLAAHADTLTLYEQDVDLRYRWLYPMHPEHHNAIGRTDADILPPQDAERIAALKREVLATGESRRAELQATLPSGTRFYDINVSPRRNGQGVVDGIAGAALDVTERKRAELAVIAARDELSRMNVELEQRVRQRTASVTELLGQMEAFSYSVSHDLRAPLRAVAAFAGALKEDHAPKLNAEGRELVDRIIRSTDRMNRLISDVLTYTRVHRDELKLAAVSLARCLREVVQHAPEMQPPAALITWSDPLPAVMGNEAFVSQVLSNLLSNAVKFVPQGRVPEVRIYAEARGDFVRLWICDNGIGIKPEFQSRLFGMFERLDGRYEGAGMGLAIVRRAVERMGGSVGVESDGTNGSRFWIEFVAVPRREHHALEATASMVA